MVSLFFFRCCYVCCQIVYFTFILFNNMDLVVIVGDVETVENAYQSKVLPYIWHSCQPVGCIFGINRESYSILYVYNSRIIIPNQETKFTLFYIWGIVVTPFHIWDMGF